MLSRFAPNDIVPLRQLFIKSDSLLSFGYIWFVKRSLSLVFLRIDGGNNNQTLGCRSFICFPASIFFQMRAMLSHTNSAVSWLFFDMWIEAHTSATPCLPMLIALVAQYSRRWRSSNCRMYVKSVSEKTSVRIFVFIITAWKSVVKIHFFSRLKNVNS